MSIEDDIDKAVKEYEEALRNDRFGIEAEAAALRVRQKLRQAREAPSDGPRE